MIGPSLLPQPLWTPCLRPTDLELRGGLPIMDDLSNTILEMRQGVNALQERL